MIGKNSRKMAAKSGRGKKCRSLDSLMGKALCILLVLILTVGAFLAPKLIGSLYDAGTLMQITYVDMDLSPYAINYLTMDDKLRAIARVKAAGGSLSVLQAGEELSDAVSDTELVEAVNREIGEAGAGINILFGESWWQMLTEESLVSRTKYTLYGRPAGGEGDTSQEMAPFQFWVLQFEHGESAQDGEKFTEKEKRYLSEYTEATDRLIVCMDADFYKIYAVSFAGSEQRLWELYDWWMSDIFSADNYTDMALETMSIEERRKMQLEITEAIMEGWADYWGTVPDDMSLYEDIQNELLGAYIYRQEGTAEEADGGNGMVSVRIEEEVNVVVDSSELADADDFARQGIADGEDMLLQVGTQGQEGWGEEDSAIWIQKIGCRDFFEMMQF